MIKRKRAKKTKVKLLAQKAKVEPKKVEKKRVEKTLRRKESVAVKLDQSNDPLKV